MKDKEIVTLYFERVENAILETDKKYGKLCRKISMGITNDIRDTEEIINDTWMTVWNTIPPKNPHSLKTYICRIAKNLSLKKYEYNHALKRKSEYEYSLEELNDCIGSKENVEEGIMQEELVHVINQFLGNISEENRILFLKRYWFLYSVKDIAKEARISEKNASMRLARIRKQLKQYLRKEGYEI